MTARLFLWQLIGILGWIAPVSLLIALRAFVPWDEWLAPLLSWLGQTGWVGMVCAIALYVPLGLLLVPASALTILIGVAHGFWSGMICATLGANLAACAGFALARAWKLGGGHTSLQQRNLISKDNPRLRDHAFWLVLLARLSVFVPFGPLNYGMGLSKVGIKDYVAGTFLGMLPGTALYLWAGTSLASSPAEAGNARNSLLALGLVSLTLLLALLGKLAHRALTGNGSETGKAQNHTIEPCHSGVGAAANSDITTS